ncbi:MAG: tRNA pseudouridine(38-40) synthase TruA [Methanobacterium sp.]|uniref:tRNA pseudouridine(38-40) synthase TruA n=1 Tax=Methanobacterium sp. TaxID=2164 RepID=UPI003D661E33|nr:tRNA pseudouridine(38-40) synthase TruA [Methanobacterium sp.]
MRKVALKVAYIGTDFHGFQRQPDVNTVENELINALKSADLIDNLKDSGYAIAGRTDRGVHALGNVISFRTPEDVVINQINDQLPQSIRILAKAGVPFGFKPRYAKSRHYRYVIAGKEDLDLDKMEEASKILEGTHDYSNFSKRSERNPIRTIDEIKVSKKDNILIIDVIGESFLWNMVRKIASVLFLAGNDDMSIDDVRKFLGPSGNASITPMPPEGLILMDTVYQDVKFKYDDYAREKFLKALGEEYLYNGTIASVEKVMMDGLGE